MTKIQNKIKITIRTIIYLYLRCFHSKTATKAFVMLCFLRKFTQLFFLVKYISFSEFFKCCEQLIKKQKKTTQTQENNKKRTREQKEEKGTKGRASSSRRFDRWRNRTAGLTGLVGALVAVRGGDHEQSCFHAYSFDHNTVIVTHS